MTSTILPSQTADALPVGVEPPISPDKSLSLSFKEKEKVITWAKKQLDVCVNPRLSFEQQWYMAMAFYFGRQNVAWVPGNTGALTRLYEPAAPPYRVRMIVNKCRRIVRTELTKVTRQVPQFYVIPNTTDDEDRMAAMAGEQIAEYELRELHFNRVVRSAAHWMTICGSSFIKTYWDPSQIDPSGELGKICLDRVTPFHLFVPDLQEEDIEDEPYVIHTMLRDTDSLKLKFGKDFVPDAEVRGGALEQRFFTALGIRSAEPTKNKVQVYEIWVKSCATYPEGALIAWAGNELLNFVDSWPYARTDFPFAKIDHIPTGRFYGESSLVDLIPLQKEVNRSHSQIIESKNKMAKPQWTAQRGSVDVNKMTSEPGLVILYTPGFQKPEPVQPPSLPTYVIDELERLTREMDDLAATGEITKGNVPPGVTAASAISYLQEENDNRFGPTVASIEDATEKIGKQLLGYVVEYWDEERLVKVLGDNRLEETRMLSKSDVRGNTDFQVETGSAAPRSRAARQAFILELVKMGGISWEQALKRLDMVETGKIYEDSQVTNRQIMREHLKMKEMGQQMAMQAMLGGMGLGMGGGLPPAPNGSSPIPGMNQDPSQSPQMGMPEPVIPGGDQFDPSSGQGQLSGMGMPEQPTMGLPTNDYDDHVAHYEGHMSYMRTSEYENLDESSKEIFLHHLMDTKQRMQIQMMENMAMQGPPVGAEGDTEGQPQSQRPQEGEYQ